MNQIDISDNYQYQNSFMSLQSYFNSKKFSIALFFNQLQEITQQLSLISQLQVDKQYANAKNILISSPTQILQEFCSQMKRKEPTTIRKILNALFQHAHNNLSAMYHLPSVDVQAKIHPILNLNGQRSSKNLQLSPNQSERSIHKISSKQKLKYPEKLNLQNSQRKVTSTLMTQKKDSVQYIQNSLLKTKPKENELKINRQKYLMDPNQNSQVKCIDLLNKKRSMSSAKKIVKQQKQEQKNRKFSSLNKDSKIIKLSEKEQDSKNQKCFTQQESERIYHEKQSDRIHQSLYKNQQVCEKLDHKIHQQAIQILYKVKQKRSPNKKHYDLIVSKSKNDQTNKHSILDISKSVLPVSMTRHEPGKFGRMID